MSKKSETGSETIYKLGQDNITPFGLDLHNPVFLISGLSIIAFVIVTLMFQEGATQFFGWLRPFLTSTFDWFFLLSANLFVLFCLYLMLSPLGKIRLGGADAKPDYSYMGWIAMLFAAGMGIGLMFFGVSEPMSHFGSSMGGTVVENGVRTDWAPLGAATGDIAAARDICRVQSRSLPRLPEDHQRDPTDLTFSYRSLSVDEPIERPSHGFGRGFDRHHSLHRLRN